MGTAARTLSAARTYVRAFNPSSSRSFVVFCLGRSGSTLLMELLASHPDIQCDNEILRKRRIAPYLYVSGRRSRARAPVYGFKMKVWHLNKRQGISDAQAFIERLYQEGWLFIHLWRRNVLRTAISTLIADARKLYHVRDAVDQQALLAGTITLSPEQVVEKLEGVLELRSEEDRLMAMIPHVKVVYEDDLLRQSAWPRTANRIFDYLSVSAAPVQSDLMPTTTSNLSDLISNHKDVQMAVRNAGYSEYLLPPA